MGLEPTTPALQVRCSTLELLPRSGRRWHYAGRRLRRKSIHRHACLGIRPDASPPRMEPANWCPLQIVNWITTANLTRQLPSLAHTGSPQHWSAGIKWWSRRDFNPRPSACEADALATELRPQVEQVNGNDPSSSRWQRDALPLSYTCLKLNAPRWCSVIAQVQRGARTNTLIALSSRAQVYWCLDFPRPDHLLGALYRIIGPALVSIRARCRAKSNLKCKTKNPLTVQVSGFQNSCFVCLTRLPPELVPPYYGHTMTTEQTIPDYEGRNPSRSGRLDL